MSKQVTGGDVSTHDCYNNVITSFLLPFLYYRRGKKTWTRSWAFKIYVHLIISMLHVHYVYIYNFVVWICDLCILNLIKKHPDYIITKVFCHRHHQSVYRPWPRCSLLNYPLQKCD